MWSPPPNAGAFTQFIEWTYSERATGKYICYGIVPRGEQHAIGVFELRQLQPGFLRGELGFVLAQRLWGRGAFAEGAGLVLDFGFDVVKIHRVEARAAIDNSRGNAALKRIGARREGRLRAAFWRDGQWVDQVPLGDPGHRLAPASAERKIAARLPCPAARVRRRREPRAVAGLVEGHRGNGVQRVDRVDRAECVAAGDDLADGHVERGGDPRDVQNGDVSEAALDTRHVRAIDPRERGK